jgi:hypothetical protein
MSPPTTTGPASFITLQSALEGKITASVTWTTPPASGFYTGDLSIGVSKTGSSPYPCGGTAHKGVQPPGTYTFSVEALCSQTILYRVTNPPGGTMRYFGNFFSSLPGRLDFQIEPIYRFVPPEADLDVTLTAVPGFINDDPAWTGRVQNKGPDTAQGVRLTVGMSRDLAYWLTTSVNSGSVSCHFQDPGTCGLDLGSLPPGENRSFTVETSPNSSRTVPPGLARAEAKVSSGTEDRSQADNAAHSEIFKGGCRVTETTCIFVLLACEAMTR